MEVIEDVLEIQEKQNHEVTLRIQKAMIDTYMYVTALKQPERKISTSEDKLHIQHLGKCVTSTDQIIYYLEYQEIVSFQK